MNNVRLDVTDTVKDLGVWFSSDLKVSNQCGKAYSKANRLLGVLKRTIENKNTDVMLRLYKTLVRPHVEYCTSARSPYYPKDKEQIEKIQHGFTKMLPAVKCLSYTDRLHRLGLWSLEERRNRADLIEVYKMLNGLSSLSSKTFFAMDDSSRTRGYS